MCLWSVIFMCVCVYVGLFVGCCTRGCKCVSPHLFKRTRARPITPTGPLSPRPLGTKGFKGDPIEGEGDGEGWGTDHVCYLVEEWSTGSKGRLPRGASVSVLDPGGQLWTSLGP